MDLLEHYRQAFSFRQVGIASLPMAQQADHAVCFPADSHCLFILIIHLPLLHTPPLTAAANCFPGSPPDLQVKQPVPVAVGIQIPDAADFEPRFRVSFRI